MRVNLDHTINSGQVFLWEKIGPKWYGINGNDVLSINENNPETILSYQKSEYDLFREEDNYTKIIKKYLMIK